MQDAANQDAAEFLAVKDDMLALLHAPQTGAYFIAFAAQAGGIGKKTATLFKLIDITIGLRFPPSAKSIIDDVVRISLGAPRKTISGH